MLANRFSSQLGQSGHNSSVGLFVPRFSGVDFQVATDIVHKIINLIVVVEVNAGIVASVIGCKLEASQQSTRRPWRRQKRKGAPRRPQIGYANTPL